MEKTKFAREFADWLGGAVSANLAGLVPSSPLADFRRVDLGRKGFFAGETDLEAVPSSRQ
jgi:hypothetical protein